MQQFLFLVAACLFPAPRAGTGAAEPLPPPVPAETRLGHRVCESVVHGPQAGQAVSLICDLAGRPGVLIYAREMEPALVKLLTKLDAVAQKGSTQQMRSTCVLLTTQDEDRSALRDIGKREKLEATILATHEFVKHGLYFGSDRRYELNPEANVTVIVLQQLTVQSSYAFRKGELKEGRVEEIVKAAAALVAATKP